MMVPIDNKADALHMIGNLVQRLENSTPFSAEQHEYLLKALIKMLSGSPGDIAFGITHPGRGKKAVSEYYMLWRDWEVCQAIRELLDESNRTVPSDEDFRSLSGKPLFIDPQDPPARKTCLSWQTIRNIYYKHFPKQTRS